MDRAALALGWDAAARVGGNRKPSLVAHNEHAPALITAPLLERQTRGVLLAVYLVRVKPRHHMALYDVSGQSLYVTFCTRRYQVFPTKCPTKANEYALCFDDDVIPL